MPDADWNHRERRPTHPAVRIGLGALRPGLVDQAKRPAEIRRERRRVARHRRFGEVAQRLRLVVVDLAVMRRRRGRDEGGEKNPAHHSK